MSATTYTVQISNDSVDLGTFASQEDAAEALRRWRGWDGVVVSHAYEIDSESPSEVIRRDDGSSANVYRMAVSAYETQAECDADEEGAHAPRIIRRRVVERRGVE